MVKYKIIFDREVCIGALSCNAVASKFWKLADDGKVDLKDSKLNEETGKWELIVEDLDGEMNMEAEKVCPVLAIKVIKLED